MADSLVDRLAKLPKLSKSELCKLWERLFETAPPPRIRSSLMISILAYRLQEETLRSLKSTARNRLRQLAEAFKADRRCTAFSATCLKAGTRLVREWRDQVHLVNVDDYGYEYQGVRYTSLSKIARQITGTRWSGPAFFGLKNEQAGQRKEIP